MDPLIIIVYIEERGRNLMYVRNLLKPGDFAAPMPIGIPLSVRYGNGGVIDAVFVGHDEATWIEVTPRIIHPFLCDRIVPKQIPIQIGQTVVKGVLYSAERIYYAAGELPEAVFEDMLNDVSQYPHQFVFYAGHVTSTAVQFVEPNAIRTWLTAAAFTVLAGWLVPYNANQNVLEKLFNSTMLQFQYPLIAGFMIHRGDQFLSVSTQLTQFVVENVETVVDDRGYIFGKISGDSRTIQVNYSDVVRFNIYPYTHVVLDAYNNITYAHPIKGHAIQPRNPQLVCSFCGKIFMVPPKGVVCCPEVDCPSTLYPKISSLLQLFGWAPLSYEDFLQLVTDKKILCLTDIFELDQYKDKEVKVLLADLMRAIVPMDAVTDSSIFTQLANKCRNSVSTLCYYIDHPGAIITELGLDTVGGRQLVDWLSDPHNSLLLKTALNEPNISYISNDSAFVGPAMFRNRKIMITGKFSHGPHDLIKAILRSYSATVVTHFSADVDILLVGDTLEQVNGAALQTAKTKGIPIMYETKFFTQYKINDDLAANGL